ncbi:uncharacterized protein LOC123987908 [Osmia bicornis bicornis]|uniref:uncharacterized protein LOC123987908 n=1 Tax=Osmia bicornis bicornis TaxID=1437191 RepID=UPI001EAEE676|nr:uncharacterized protein LOC123987908 [Osmia bicornis bicornis]
MAHSGIQIMQINLHHSKSASAILARSLAVMHTGIALVQEPWLVHKAIRGLGGCGNIYHVRSEEKPRTCIIVKGLNATLLPQVSNGDITVIRLRLNLNDGGIRKMLLGSIYMPYDSPDPPPQPEVMKVTELARKEGLELLLGCDANCHHTGWGSTNINSRGESLHEFLISTELFILNRGTKPTFMDFRRQEVIDITISSQGLVDLVRDWRVSNEPSGSDHRLIRFSLQLKVATTWTRNPRRTNWDGYRADLDATIKNIPTKFHTRKDLETSALCLGNAITDAYEANCPLKPKTGSSRVPWWTPELAKLKTETRKRFNKARNTGLAVHWEIYRSSQKEYSKAIVKAKRKSCRDFCGSIEETPEASRLCRILSSDHRTQLNCLQLPNGEFTSSESHTLKHLLETHFPGFQETTPTTNCYSTGTGDSYKPRDWLLANKIAQPRDIEWAIKTFRPYKAPGPDGIFPALLQEGLNVLIGPLTKILRASIALRHVPQVWVNTKIVFIPKSGKNGHIRAKDFRPISLASFLLKTLERLVDRYLRTGPLTLSLWLLHICL